MNRIKSLLEEPSQCFLSRKHGCGSLPSQGDGALARTGQLLGRPLPGHVPILRTSGRVPITHREYKGTMVLWEGLVRAAL